MKRFYLPLFFIATLLTFAGAYLRVNTGTVSLLTDGLLGAGILSSFGAFASYVLLRGESLDPYS